MRDRGGSVTGLETFPVTGGFDSYLSMALQWCAALLGVVLVVACGGETGFSGPPPDDDGDELRPGLTVRVEVEEERAEIAEALGWTGGVPGAEVRIHRLGTDFAWEIEETDASGVARFPDAIPGTYRVAGYRPLTAAEESQAGEGVLALGDGCSRRCSSRRSRASA